MWANAVLGPPSAALLVMTDHMFYLDHTHITHGVQPLCVLLCGQVRMN
jgi:hypothetical protein